MDRPGIVVVGSTMIDLVAYADRLPNDPAKINRHQAENDE